MAPTEDFASAARRHESAARSLLALGHLDDAVYLCGYVVECALKHRLKAREPSFKAKDFSHNNSRLAAAELLWWVLLIIDDAQMLGALVDNALLEGHPERRYWADHWNRAQAERAVGLSAALLNNTVLSDILDGKLPFPGGP